MVPQARTMLLHLHTGGVIFAWMTFPFPHRHTQTDHVAFNMASNSRGRRTCAMHAMRPKCRVRFEPERTGTPFLFFF